MQQNFLTIDGEAVFEFEIQKSIFIGYVKNVQTDEQAKEFINAIKSKHFDATHNCSAYVVGGGSVIQKRFSDDGEPQGTAGMPILDVIEKKGLADVVCVVTRYFGGVKLGAGGLVRAYSMSASRAIEQAKIVKNSLAVFFEANFDYSTFSKIENGILKLPVALVDKKYDNDIRIVCAVETLNYQDVENKFLELSNGKTVIKQIKMDYYNFEI